MNLFEHIRKKLDPYALSEDSSRKQFEEIFQRSIRELRTLFSDGPHDLCDATLPAYPTPNYLGKQLGIEAFGLSFDLEVDQYPIFWNRLKEGRNEVRPWHFKRARDDIELHTLINPMSIRSGRLARIVTNDLEVVNLTASKDFGPPSPWLVWYEVFPTFGLFTQGEPESWFHATWQPFWLNLTVDEQTTYLRKKRELTKQYMSEDDWRAWVTRIRLADSRTGDNGWDE